MYYINNIDDLTPQKVLKIIQEFRGNELPLLDKYKNYYNGEQEILHKYVVDETKPCNKLVVNYCADIVNNYQGYLTGVPIAYSSTEDITDLINILKHNDHHNEDNDLLHNALICGVAYELNYLDVTAQQKFKILDSTECIPIYSNDLEEELLAVIRMYSANDLDNINDAYIDIYTANEIRHYKTDIFFTSMGLLNVEPHYYCQVPITVFKLNRDCKSIFADILTLQDAYNKLLSAHVDDYEAFVDAYMVLKGVTADEDDLAEMKHQRILLLDEEDTAEYLTKPSNTAVIDGLLDRINYQIQKIAKSPDFNDEKFLAQSGIAIRYKIMGMENNASNIESSMRKALQKRLELICAIQKLTVDSFAWRDINIVFTRNLPVNEMELAQLVNQLRSLVSDKTLLSLLPFIPDVDKELEQLNEQSSAANVFDFGNLNE